MPVVAAAVCPHPPLLVPQIAAGAAAETEDLRRACASAVEVLRSAAPDRVLLVGTGQATGIRYGPGILSSFAAYGAPDVAVDIGPVEPSGTAPGFVEAGDGDPAGAKPDGVPLSMLTGAWILESAGGLARPWSGLTVAAGERPDACAALGRALSREPDDIALLVSGDGSARRSEHAPAHLHPRAEVFDSTVAEALAGADTEVLAHLDPDLATELAAAGRAAWQVLAGAASRRSWQADLLYAAAPYGVGYFVATWLPA